jgi:D-alanine-D-alanine ligase
MNILTLIDPETRPDDDPAFERAAAGDDHLTEYQVIQTLRQLHHEVTALPFGPDVGETLRQLVERKPEVVFNLTEHYGGDRRMDVNIAAALELLRIPFTGTGSVGLMLCRDKAICKRILSHHRVKVPDFIYLPEGKTRPPRKLSYPFLVKPVSEDGSDGISLASLVQDDGGLVERARMIHERMRQPVICEEYVEGRELYVGILGNDRLRALPPRELKFGESGDGGPQFATARVKRDGVYRKKWGIRYVHAELEDELAARVARTSKRIYQLLHLRDYARIDLRLTTEGEVVFLEANPNPDLAADEDLAQAAAKAGLEFPGLLEFIVNQARRRHTT